MVEEFRLTLDKSESNSNLTVDGTRTEWEALVKMLEREFIPHEYYEEIHSILNKINVKLVR